MKYVSVICLLFISLLLCGAVCAQTVNDFKVDKDYSSAFNGTDYSLYLNKNQDSGVIIYKDLYTDVDDDAYDDLIHDHGRDYVTPDDDFKMDKNSDNTVNFTDYDHRQHGVCEVVNIDGQQFVVVFWAKDSSSINNNDLMNHLNEFNKNNNNLKAVAV